MVFVDIPQDDQTLVICVLCEGGVGGGEGSFLTDQSWEEKPISDFRETNILRNLEKFCTNCKIFAAKFLPKFCLFYIVKISNPSL